MSILKIAIEGNNKGSESGTVDPNAPASSIEQTQLLDPLNAGGNYLNPLFLSSHINFISSVRTVLYIYFKKYFLFSQICQLHVGSHCRDSWRSAKRGKSAYSYFLIFVI